MKREHNIESELPDGYSELEYIESTGTQYIDTLQKVSPSLVWTTDMQYVSSFYGDKNYFGAEDYDSCFLRISLRTNTNPNNIILLFSDADKIKAAYMPDNLYERHTFVLKNGECLIDGNVVCEGNTITNSGAYNICLFASNLNGTITNHSKARLFYSEFVYDNAISRAFVPVLRTSDNKPGLYDLCGSICPLTGTPFYVNAGTGEFLYK